MPRPRRIRFNPLAVLSLILFGTTVAIWILGQWTSLRLCHLSVVDDAQGIRTREAAIIIADDALVFRLTYREFEFGSPYAGDVEALRADLREERGLAIKPAPSVSQNTATLGGGWGGFAFAAGQYVGEGIFVRGWPTDSGRGESDRWYSLHPRWKAFALPWWLFALIFGLLPARVLYRRFRRTHPPGSCRECGYDLRATPDRCPECGTVPDAAKRPAAQPLARR